MIGFDAAAGTVQKDGENKSKSNSMGNTDLLERLPREIKGNLARTRENAPSIQGGPASISRLVGKLSSINNILKILHRILGEKEKKGIAPTADMP